MKNAKFLSIIMAVIMILILFAGCSSANKDFEEYEINVITIYRDDNNNIVNIAGRKGSVEFWNAKARTGNDIVISGEYADKLQEGDTIKVRKHVDTSSGEKEEYFEVIAIVSKQ